MISRIVFLGITREDFSFRRRTLGPGFVLVNKNSQAVIIRGKAGLRRSLIFGTVISSGENDGYSDKIISSREVLGGDFGSSEFHRIFKNIKNLEMYYAP